MRYEGTSASPGTRRSAEARRAVQAICHCRKSRLQFQFHCIGSREESVVGIQQESGLA